MRHNIPFNSKKTKYNSVIKKIIYFRKSVLLH